MAKAFVARYRVQPGKPSLLSPLGSVMAGQPITVQRTWQK